ncbi:MAG: glutathione-regulated potassium-efflux system protein KefB, partial [Gammaproteobacteria bacterium]
MTSQDDILLSGFILVFAAVVAVSVFKRLGLGSVLGYLVAGFVVGPSVLGVASDVDTLRHFAEFGVVFLLFIIGLEMHPSRLWSMRVAVFGMGTAQIILTAAAIAIYAYWQGAGLNTAIVIGLSLSLSSTAIVMQILKDKGEITSPHGQTTFAILLMQDIAVVPLIALIPFLSDVHSDTGISVSGVLTPILAVIAVLLGTRYVIRPVLPYIARFGTSEVFTGFSLLTVLGAAWLMDKAGMSMAMGAFLVGLMLSESRYVHQIEADMESFRGFLLGLFFMAVGMSIDIDIVTKQSA